MPKRTTKSPAVEYRLRFEIWRSKVDRLWYFHLKAANGEIICASEGYTRKLFATQAINMVRAFTDAPVWALKK